MITEPAIRPAPRREHLGSLSNWERQILDGLCAGLSNEAIAPERNVSPKTVRNHLTHIFDTLQVNSRT